MLRLTTSALVGVLAFALGCSEVSQGLYGVQSVLGLVKEAKTTTDDVGATVKDIRGGTIETESSDAPVKAGNDSESIPKG